MRALLLSLFVAGCVHAHKTNPLWPYEVRKAEANARMYHPGDYTCSAVTEFPSMTFCEGRGGAPNLWCPFIGSKGGCYPSREDR